jgi:hypothetical protein
MVQLNLVFSLALSMNVFIKLFIAYLFLCFKSVFEKI